MSNIKQRITATQSHPIVGSGTSTHKVVMLCLWVGHDDGPSTVPAQSLCRPAVRPVVDAVAGRVAHTGRLAAFPRPYRVVTRDAEVGHVHAQRPTPTVLQLT